MYMSGPAFSVVFNLYNTHKSIVLDEADDADDDVDDDGAHICVVFARDC